MATVLEAQELTVHSWNPWMQDDDVVRDHWGNYKGSVTFDQYKSEPLDATFKTEPKVGDKKYGAIIEYQTKSGKTRLKFQRAERPEGQQSGSSKPAYQPRDDMAIRAQWAIGQAVQLEIAAGGTPAQLGQFAQETERVAKELFAMVDRVKGSNVPETISKTFNGGEPLPDEMPPDFLKFDD